MEIQRDCVCANVRRASRALTGVYDRFLSSTGLRITQFSLLSNIRRLEKATVSTLSERLLMDKTTLTRNVKLLQKKGLVRTKAGRDRRVKEINLTAEGINALNAARPLWEDAQNHAVKYLGKDRTDQLIADLALLIDVAGG